MEKGEFSSFSRSFLHLLGHCAEVFDNQLSYCYLLKYWKCQSICSFRMVVLRGEKKIKSRPPNRILVPHRGCFQNF